MNNTRNRRSVISKNLHAQRAITANDIKTYVSQYNALFSDIYNKLLVKLQDRTDNISNFIVFVAESIKIISEEAASLHGYQKKELAIDLVKSVVESMPIDEEDKNVLRNFVYPSLDNTVDLFIAAGKGYLFLKKVEEEIEAECAKCQTKCSNIKCAGCRHNKAIRRSILLDVPRTGEGVVYLEQLTDVVYSNLRDMLSKKQVTVNNIIGIVTLAMQLVQQYGTLNGVEKKQVVVNAITRVVDEIPMNESDRIAVKAVVATTLSKTIDYVIAIANGEIDLFGQIEEGVARCKVMCGCN